MNSGIHLHHFSSCRFSWKSWQFSSFLLQKSLSSAWTNLSYTQRWDIQWPVLDRFQLIFLTVVGESWWTWWLSHILDLYNISQKNCFLVTLVKDHRFVLNIYAIEYRVWPLHRMKWRFQFCYFIVLARFIDSNPTSHSFCSYNQHCCPTELKTP